MSASPPPTSDPFGVCVAMLDHIESGNDAALGDLVSQVVTSSTELGRDAEHVLSAAVETGRLATVRRLLPLGVHRYATVSDPIGRRALSMAVHALRLGFGRIAVTLLEAGCNGWGAPHQEEAWATVGRDLMSWAELRPSQLEALVPLARSHPAMLLSPAIRAGRGDIVEYLLTEGLRATPPRGTEGEAPLIAAVLEGAVGLIPLLVRHGAPVNRRDRNGHTPLHRVLRATETDEAERGPVVIELLRQLAVPEVRTSSGLDAYRLADRLGQRQLGAILRTHGLRYGPRQSREARAEGIQDVSLYYAKADGFVYRIGRPACPFLVGGDYDGARPTGALEAREEFERFVEKYPQRRVGWFRPFLEKVLHGRDFALSELMVFEDRFSLYRFGDTTNWGS